MECLFALETVCLVSVLLVQHLLISIFELFSRALFFPQSLRHSIKLNSILAAAFLRND